MTERDSETFSSAYFREGAAYARFTSRADAERALLRWYTGMLSLVSGRKGADLTAGQLVLEIGCGYGPLLSALSDRGLRVIGSDISQFALREIRAHKRNERLFNADASILPVRDHSVDVIFALELLEHVPYVPTALREIHRALSTRGCLVATTPNPFGNILPSFDAWADATHTSVYSPRRWRKLLKDAGFDQISVTTTVAPPYIWRFGGIFSRQMRLPIVGPTAVIIARP